MNPRLKFGRGILGGSGQGWGDYLVLTMPEAWKAAEELPGEVPVYFYRFDWDDTRFRKKMGAFHSLDVPFVFGHFTLDSRIERLMANKKVVEAGRPLSEQVMAYYTNFPRPRRGHKLSQTPKIRLEKISRQSRRRKLSQ